MSRAAVGERGIYLYGVAAAADAGALPQGAGGIDPRHPLEVIVQGEVAAVASDVDVERVQEDLRGAEDGDLTRLEPLVRAHEEVLARALDADALVPFRFGTIFPNEAELRAFLSERERELEETLQRLAGAREWGVKGLLDPGVPLRPGAVEADPLRGRPLPRRRSRRQLPRPHQGDPHRSYRAKRLPRSRHHHRLPLDAVRLRSERQVVVSWPAVRIDHDGG